MARSICRSDSSFSPQEPAEAAEPAPRVEGGPFGTDRLGQGDRLLLQLRRRLDLAEQVALLGGRLDHLGALGRIVDVGARPRP